MRLRILGATTLLFTSYPCDLVFVKCLLKQTVYLMDAYSVMVVSVFASKFLLKSKLYFPKFQTLD